MAMVIIVHIARTIIVACIAGTTHGMIHGIAHTIILLIMVAIMAIMVVTTEAIMADITVHQDIVHRAIMAQMEEVEATLIMEEVEVIITTQDLRDILLTIQVALARATDQVLVQVQDRVIITRLVRVCVQEQVQAVQTTALDTILMQDQVHVQEHQAQA